MLKFQSFLGLNAISVKNNTVICTSSFRDPKSAKSAKPNYNIYALYTMSVLDTYNFMLKAAKSYNKKSEMLKLILLESHNLLKSSYFHALYNCECIIIDALQIYNSN